MAVAVLSPWPSSPAALTAARACLGPAIGATGDSAIDRLGSTAAALVERHAPGAPQAVKNEAVIRCAGWLRSAPASGVASRTVGPMTVSYSPTRYAALRHSGAMSLLAPYKVRRAGLAG